MEVVKDFKLAQLPNKKTKYGHKFYTNWDPSFKLYNEAYFYLHDAPLTMRDIAVIFIESSKTSTPALVLTKYLKTHYEDVYKRNLAATASHKDDFISSAPGHTKIGRETIASSAHHSPMKDTTESFNLNNASNADTRESNHRSSMGVPWDEIVDWMDKDESWDVVNGLNFVQFVDCLAKCGILAYSSAKFNDVLQNPVEKVEHFFIAHLGLAGSSTGRTDWKAKADARLIAIKSKIKSTYGKNFTATTTTA